MKTDKVCKKVRCPGYTHNILKFISLKNIDHAYYMNIAIEEAKSSGSDIPIASLIIHQEEIISISTNKKEQLNDPTAHAEMLVIQETSKKLKKWRLSDVIIYITLEPCPMCASAILYSRIPLVVFGAYDPLYGAMGSVLDLKKICNFYNPTVIGGIEEMKSQNLLKGFFR